MSESEQRLEIPPPGGVAWLDVSAQTADSWPGRLRTGPLGLQISALAGARPNSEGFRRAIKPLFNKRFKRILFTTVLR